MERKSEGLYTADFSAVLRDIFQQTQTEIDYARNRGIASHVKPSPMVNGEQSHNLPVNDPDYSYQDEPLWDPALSYISDILAEDDDEQNATNLMLSHEEFVAYQAKLAAVLKEDSPSLDFNVEGWSPGSSDGISPSISISEDYLDALVHTLNAKSPESSLFSSIIDSEASRNEILLTSLTGPVDGKASSSSSFRF